MCCDDKCFFFIRVRTGSLIFGYIAAVITALSVLICMGFMLGVITYGIVYRPNNDTNMILMMVEPCFLWCTAGFTCTVLLLCGITQNKPALVKTYVIFGMIQLVLLLVIAIILMCVGPIIGGIALLVCCVIYILCLYMIYLTHKQMTADGGRVFEPPNLIMA